MIAPLRAFQLYRALKLHFTTEKYDITKTKGNIFVKQEMLKGRQSFAINKLVNKYQRETELIHFFVANFITGDKYGGLFDIPAGTDIYLEWLGRQEKLGYMFKADLEMLSLAFEPPEATSVEWLWDSTDGHPPLLVSYLAQRISLETLVLLEKSYTYKGTLDVTLFGDPVWSEVSRLIGKYRPFVKLARERMVSITSKVLGVQNVNES